MELVPPKAGWRSFDTGFAKWNEVKIPTESVLSLVPFLCTNKEMNRKKTNPPFHTSDPDVIVREARLNGTELFVWFPSKALLLDLGGVDSPKAKRGG